MSMDKFGRYAKKKQGVAGPKGEGFNLTSEGDYDIQLKRLRNVDAPTDNLDAVNYETHLEAFRNCISLQNGQFDAQSTRICNMGQPMETNDAVTVGYVSSRVPIKIDDKKTYSVHQYRMQDVAYPENDGDAVNLLYVKKNALSKGDGDFFDAKGYLLRNVAVPIEETDAVNLSYFNANTLTKNMDGAYDVKNTVIQNLAPPTKGGDAVNKSFLDNRLQAPGKFAYHFKHKRLGNVADPEGIHEAVTVNYLNEHGLLNGADGEWDVREKRLKNVARPYGLSDAVNKRYVKDVIGDLAYTIYKLVNQNKRSSVISKEDWDMQVVQETSTWDELFGIGTPATQDPSV